MSLAALAYTARVFWHGRVNLKHIEAFRAVMAAGSTTGAAALLGLSQPAVSRQLAQLEAELGFELFSRNKGRLLARPEAQALLAEVDQLAELVSRVGRLGEELRAGSAGHRLLKIAVPHSLATTIMPGVVAGFLADWPDASVEILTGSSHSLERLVAERTADMALVRLPPEGGGFARRALLQSDAVCVMPRGHALAALPRVGPADLARHALVLLGRGRPIRQEIDAAFGKSRTIMRCRVEAHSVECACALVAAGLGVTVVTRFMAVLFDHLPIEIRPFAPGLQHVYGLISREDAPLSRNAVGFADRLGAALTARLGPAR